MSSILDQLDAEGDRHQNTKNKYNKQMDILRKDIQFYQIALILSGKRDDLEKWAFELIRDEGSVLKALQKSKHIARKNEL